MAAPRCLICPWHDHPEPIDVTDALIGAVAHELWKHGGGNATLNWLEAEAFIHELLRNCQAVDADSLPFQTLAVIESKGTRQRRAA